MQDYWINSYGLVYFKFFLIKRLSDRSAIKRSQGGSANRHDTDVLANTPRTFKEKIRGILPGKLGGIVRPTSQKPYPICDQNLRFSLPYPMT